MLFGNAGPRPVAPTLDARSLHRVTIEIFGPALQTSRVIALADHRFRSIANEIDTGSAQAALIKGTALLPARDRIQPPRRPAILRFFFNERDHPSSKLCS